MANDPRRLQAILEDDPAMSLSQIISRHWLHPDLHLRLPIGVLVPSLIWVCLFNAQAIGQDSIDPTTRMFLESHCLRCHNDSTQEGDFRIDNLAPRFSDPVVAQQWSEVLFRINAGEMPPADEPQPTATELGTAVEAISRRIRQAAAARMAQRGPFEIYRLSRSEYAHTIYDLLGVVYDVEAPGAFNEDPRWQGFDRIGAMLSVAPSHIQRYFEAAETVTQIAFPDTNIPSQTDRRLVGEGKRQLLQLGEGWSFHLDHPGHYKLRIRVSGLPAFSGRVPRLSLWHKHHNRSFAGVDLIAAETAPETVDFEGLFPAGQYEIRNHAKTVKHANGGISLFRNETIDATTRVSSLKGGHRSPWTKVVDEQGKPTMPLLLVDWIEIEGPILTDSDLAKRAGVFPDDEEDREETRDCLLRFAERAWRRPVNHEELDPYTRLIAAEQNAGETFQSAYRSALTSMLVARSFFNLEEGSPNQNRRKINHFELANRLSYFLWSSMPDEQLFHAARTGKLRSPERLAAEFDRMIVDPKVDRFLDSFPKQWLQLHRVGMFQPDPNIYPEYGPWLKESMVMETTGYFAEMFRINLPVRDAIDSNWTMLNPRLAIHYLLPSPKQLELVRTTLTAESGRGGILTHASVLSLSSDGTRHRPVHRGAWISEAFFAHTPPPPPPNVDPLEPVVGNQPKRTIRSKLEAHAANPNCVSCHAKIDPLGLAFENFDAIGRWRETEHVEGGIGTDPPVDPSGTLADGRSFANASDFKTLLAENDRRLAEVVLEQLATYGLRRVMTVDDRAQIRAIAISTQDQQYGLQSLIRALIMSDLFQKR